jgi:hypothetical protein
MHIVRCLVLSSLMLLPVGSTLRAQSPAEESPSSGPAQTYKLTFTVTQLVKGKEAGRRVYSALFTPQRNSSGSIRVQNHMAVSTSPPGREVNTQYTYHDVGVDIDFSAPSPEITKGVSARQLPLTVAADVSALAPADTPGLLAPSVRDDRWKSTLIVGLDKPTMLFISDDPYTDLSTRVDLTATLVPAQ